MKPKLNFQYSGTKRLLQLLVLGFITLSLLGCTSSESTDEGQGEERNAAVVDVATVERTTLQESLQAIGSLRADQTARISPEIAGNVEEVAFTEGETVAAGDVLVKLDDDKLQDQYQSRKFSLEESRATLENARRTYNRNQRLQERDMISAQELDNSRANFETARARVNRLESQVQEARERLEDATIRAPFTGSVGSKEVDSGNYVQPGTTLTTLYRLNPLEVRFTVPGRFVGRVQTGQKIRLHVSSQPDTAFPGDVYFVSPSIREQTRDLLVKARVQNPNFSLKPGAFARVELIVETLKDRPVIPAEALIATREGYIVFTVQNGTAKRTPVEIGLRQPELVEVRKGLSVGDRVITSGHLSVSDGSPVEVANENK